MRPFLLIFNNLATSRAHAIARDTSEFLTKFCKIENFMLLINSEFRSTLVIFFTFLFLFTLTNQLMNNFYFEAFPKCRYHLYDLEIVRKTYETEMKLSAEAYPINQNKTQKKAQIGILIVVEGETDAAVFRRAMSTMKCYAQIHGYEYLVVSDKPYLTKCLNADIYFRRHCVAAILLDKFEYMLFIDADVGVINPNRTIEEFIDDRFDVTLYDRFFNQEVAAGSYLVRNTQFAKDYLHSFALFEHKRDSKMWQGTDNEGLHAYLANTILGEDNPTFRICMDLFQRARDRRDLNAYESCIRMSLGNREDFGKIRILRKGTGWMRDGWLTFGMWNPRHDFMIHGWKEHQFWNYDNCDLPLDISSKIDYKYFYPIAGEIDLEKCHSGNTSWSYDMNLLAGYDEMEGEYMRMKYKIEQSRYLQLINMTESLGMVDD